MNAANVLHVVSWMSVVFHIDKAIFLLMYFMSLVGCLSLLFPVDHILKQILPAGVEVPSSFETIVKYTKLNFMMLLLLFHFWCNLVTNSNLYDMYRPCCSSENIG